MKKKIVKTNQSYVVSVSLGTGCYRHIRISADVFLEQLSDAILDAFSFCDDHLHIFFMDNKYWSRADAFVSPRYESGDRVTSGIRLSRLGLSPGRQFKYIFDFGDEWRFQCKVLRVLDEPTEKATVVRSVGEAPNQYGDEDESDDEDWDDEDPDDEDGSDQDGLFAAPPEACAAIPDELFEKALLYKNTNLWMKLYDSQLFAVRHSDGTIGYCCVMGMLGEHIALAVYPGGEGLASYRMIHADSPEVNEFERHAMLMSQNCVMLSFENKSDLLPGEAMAANDYCQRHGIELKGKLAYPHFQKISPQHLPWYLSDAADQQRMLEALDAAIAASERVFMVVPESVGFTGGKPYDRRIPLLEKAGDEYQWTEIALPDPAPAKYPAFCASDDITMARLLKSQRKGEWACDVIMHTSAVIDQRDSDTTFPTNAPYFPYILLIVDNISGLVLDVTLGDNTGDYSDQFGKAAIDLAMRNGRPLRILVPNDRAHALFADLAKQFDANLLKRKQIAQLKDAEESLWEQFSLNADERESKVNELMEMLADPQSCDTIPDETLLEILRVADNHALPEHIKNTLSEVRRRRGL